MSHTAQEAKLDRELLRFEDMLELFLVDKDMFLEDLYRRLKQVTSLWRSWRGQRLRDVPVTHLVSTKQVKTAIRDIRTWVNWSADVDMPFSLSLSIGREKGRYQSRVIQVRCPWLWVGKKKLKKLCSSLQGCAPHDWVPYSLHFAHQEEAGHKFMKNIC